MRRTPQETALLITVGTHALVIVLVVAGAILMREDTPTGFFALGSASAIALCPKCMAAVLTGRRREPKSAVVEEKHGH